jgi:hypothetical protein
MINELFVFIAKIKFGVDGDVVDRMHHKYTVFFLIFLALFLSAESLIGEKIKCFSPVYYPGKWHTYISRLCWVKNTYYVDMNNCPDGKCMTVSEAKANGEVFEVEYYQWASIILALAAVCFYLPCKLWYYFADRAGLNIDNMIQTCSNFTVVIDEGKRKSTFTNLALFLDRFFDVQALNAKKQSRPFYKLFGCCFRNSGSYLGFGYLVTKCVYLLNVILQFVFMTQFMGHSTKFHNFGLSITNFLTQGMVWEDQSRFPRVTMCDIEKRELGDITRQESVQCVLPQNIYMEKAFILVWWWYIMLIIITALNLIQWIIRIYATPDNRQYVKTFLQTTGKYPIAKEERNDKLRRILNFFVDSYLMQDGVFVLRLLSKNVSTLMMSCIVTEIWNHLIQNFDEELRQRGIEDTSQFDLDEDLALVGKDENDDDDSDGESPADYSEADTMNKNKKDKLYPSLNRP